MCIHTTTSFPFICRWTSRLHPCSSYCKYCCNEQWDTWVLINFGFLRVYPRSGISGSLMFYHIWPLLCWGGFPLCPFLKSFNHKWVMDFVKSFFCIYWDYHVGFILSFVNMVYHIDWFAYIVESLRPWNRPNLIMVYELFDVLLNCLLKFCWGFLHLCSSVILACSFLFCVVFEWFWYQGDGGLVEWIWMCSFLCSF